MAAYASGVNYFDTAFIYPGSEAAMGEIFRRNGIRKKLKKVKKELEGPPNKLIRLILKVVKF